MNADTIPIVDPMMVRQFTLTGVMTLFGGVLVMDEYEIEEIGMATTRLDYDTDVVDCSGRIFEITTEMMLCKTTKPWTAFPSRRWRNLREGEEIKGLPSKEVPLLFIGNPVRLLVGEDGLTVMREKTYLIKSGMALGF